MSAEAIRVEIRTRVEDLKWAALDERQAALDEIGRLKALLPFAK